MPAIRPILFNTLMVQALLDGRKVQTRRPITKPIIDRNFGCEIAPNKVDSDSICPIGNVGDLLYVRETFRLYNNSDECGCSEHCSCPPTGTPVYRSNCNDSEVRWTPSIHMPRKYSRLTLEITGVRVERIQSIGNEDAEAEGLKVFNEDDANLYYSGTATEDEWPHGWFQNPVEAFSRLWSEVYKNWYDNPWVWVIDFKVHRINVDEMQ